MIDINKKYRTRDGMEVRIYATDGIYPYPIHGAIKWPKGWIDRTWDNDGKSESHALDYWDLVEVTPRHKRMVWLNIMGTSPHGHYYLSRADADLNAGIGRTECIKVELDFEEGEGL